MRRSFSALGACALVAASFVVTLARPAPAAAAVPAGFTDVFVTSIANPTASAAAPGGSILVASQGGQLTLVRNGVKQSTLALDLGAVTCSNSERGLLGVAVDPGFEPSGSSGAIYLYYTRNESGTCTNRVSRFTMTNGVVDPGSETVLLDGIASIGGNHNGGDLEFDHDGHLLVSVGDSGCNPRNIAQCSADNPAAQDLGLLNGKILRINTDGTPAAGNPFTGSNTARCNAGAAGPGISCQEIFALGFRNPFRIAVNPNSSGPRIYANDVGLNTWEEVDDVIGGGNYGWNTFEGPCVTGSTTNCPAAFPPGVSGPVTAYSHGSGCNAITGGAFVPDGAWPVQYQGAYLYGDYLCGKIWSLRPGQASADTFADLGVGGPISMHFVSEAGGASLYYTTYRNGGELHRITADTQTLPSGPSRFVGLTPVRLLDTRLNTGGSTGKLTAGMTIGLQVTGGVVPPGAIAVALNVTMADTGAAGFVKVWPSRTPVPDVSNVNASSGETVANASIVALPPDGQLSIQASTATHVIVDVSGYWLPFTSATAGRFVTAPSPARLFDTRFGNNVPAARVEPGQTLTVDVLGHAGVPASGVGAVALTVTADGASGLGFVKAWPANQAEPDVSNLNPQNPGDVRANLVIVPLSTDGKVGFSSASSVNLLADVVGWFTDSSAPAAAGGLFFPLAPTRLADTRFGNPTTRPGAGAVTAFPFGGPVPTTASAVAFNLTGAQSANGGFLEAFPADAARPDTSTVNFSAGGQDRAAFALSRRAPGGVWVYGSVAADEIVDVAGYFN